MTRTEDDLRLLYADRVATAPNEAELLAWLDETTSDGVETLSARRLHVVQPWLRRLVVVVSAVGLVAAVVIASLRLGGGLDSNQHSDQTGASNHPDQPKSQGIQAALIDPDHPHVLQVVASVAFRAKDQTCQYRRSVTVTKQTKESVSVLVAPPKAAAAETHQQPELMHCTTPKGLLPTTVSLPLKAHLGTRAVIDKLSGRSVPVFDLSTLPQPRVAPPGYTAEPVRLTGASISGTGVVGTARVTIADVQPPLDPNTVQVARTYRHGSDVLQITEGPPDPAFDPTRVDPSAGKPMSVDGHRAYSATTPDKHHDNVCLTWKASVSRSVLVCSLNDPLDTSKPGPAPLTLAQVLAIATTMETSR